MQPREICFYCADQNPQRDRSLGITNYTNGLLNALKQSGLVELRAVVSKSSSGVPVGIPTTVLPFGTDHVFGRLSADNLHPIIVGNRIEAEIWHYPKGFLPPLFQVKQPKIGTIADTILQYYADHYPQQRGRAAFAYWIAMLRNAVRKFDLIITVSEFSKRSILEFAHRYQLKAPPIYVTYQGANPSPPPTEEQSPRNYVLHLASTQPHKRTNWLLEQWRCLQAREVSLPQLRLIGSVDHAGGGLIAQLRNAVASGPVSRADVLAAMRNALALILPSEIEGFGLPALESYYGNTPVVYVKDTAVEEVLGAGTPGGFRFDDDSFSAALDEVLALDASRTDQKRIELEQRFSWQRCMSQTLACYSRALGVTVAGETILRVEH